MAKSIILLSLLLSSGLQAATPTISSATLTTDTNTAVVRYTATPDSGRVYAITAVTFVGGIMEYTIGTHNIKVGSAFTSSGITCSPMPCTSVYDKSEYITAVTATTVSFNNGFGSGSPSSGGTLSVRPFCWVQYGVASGVGHPENYLWSSVTFPSGYIPDLCSVNINGLKDGTRYYFRPTARPYSDDEVDTCNFDGCGAAELSDVTAASTVSHLPAPPISVDAEMLTYPNTTGYATVPLAATGANGECVCNCPGGVAAPSGFSWTIGNSETLTSIIANGRMTYGTLFEIPPGTTCNIPNFDVRGHGYYLNGLAPDSANPSRWLIFRTQLSNNLPPFGVRTNPDFASHYGGFKSVTPSSGSLGTGGTIFNFQGQNPPVNHVLLDRIMFSVDETQTTAAYEPFIFLATGEGGNQPPYANHISFRGNYFHGPARSNLFDGHPGVIGVINGTADNNIVISDNYVDNINYVATTPFTGIPMVFAFQDTGFTQVYGPASKVLIDNNYVSSSMGMSIYVEVNNHGNPNTTDYTITHNTLHWPYANYPYAVDISTRGFACRNHLESKGFTRAAIIGNWFDGQWACGNTGNTILMFNPVDLTISSNYLIRVASAFGLNGNGSGNGMTSYPSSGNRILISNNVINKIGRSLWPPNSGVYLQAGAIPGGVPIIESESSPSNVTMVGNTIGPVGIDNPAGPTKGGFSPWLLYNGGGGQLAGLKVERNILPFGIGVFGGHTGGIFVQNALNGTPGVLSHPGTPLPTQSISPVDFVFKLNTIAGYADGAPGRGMSGVSVIAGGSGYASGSLTIGGCSTSPTQDTPTGTYDSFGGGVYIGQMTVLGVCVPTTPWTVSAGAGGASLRPHYGLTPNYSWKGNKVYCTTDAGGDDASACPAIVSTMPAGDTYTTGGTMQARLTAAGFPNLMNDNYGCVPTTQSSCGAGADVETLKSKLGIVSQITIRVSAGSASVSYLAPDDRACWVDLSNNAGTSWQTRTSDGGGGRQRIVVFSSLTAALAYLYRIHCYYDQVRGVTDSWFAFPSDTSNLQTNGGFTTLATGNSSPSFTFSLSDFPGSDHFRVTMTPTSGSPSVATCTTSPCSPGSIAVGDYSVVRAWLKSGTAIASSDPQQVPVR